MADLATLKSRLAAAEDAEFKLLTQDKRVSTTIGGQSVTYTPADLPKLQQYIERLRADIARLEGTRRRGPIYLG